MELAMILMLSIGLVFFLVGIGFLAAHKKTWNCSEQTTGQIVDMCMNGYDYNNGKGEQSDTAGETSYSMDSCYPVYSYCVNGQEYLRAHSVAYSKNYVYKLMKKPVTIYYNPENPKEANLGKMSSLVFMGIIFSGLGALAMVVGVILAVISM